MHKFLFKSRSNDFSLDNGGTPNGGSSNSRNGGGAKGCASLRDTQAALEQKLEECALKDAKIAELYEALRERDAKIVILNSKLDKLRSILPPPSLGPIPGPQHRTSLQQLSPPIRSPDSRTSLQETSFLLLPGSPIKGEPGGGGARPKDTQEAPKVV
ncbi:unnamed protein product [Meganyctiphanes norvegica]|uniref:Uncharacterized protein n=1 Tax=Meganyctiphanes norvegica TaxID=48144 RepID=A0AAV2PR65_MEGNR